MKASEHWKNGNFNYCSEDIDATGVRTITIGNNKWKKSYKFKIKDKKVIYDEDVKEKAEDVKGEAK